MLVLFDYQAFSMQRYGGVSRYVFELVRELRHTEHVDVELCGRFARNEHLALLGAPSVGVLHWYEGRGCGTLHALADRLNARTVERRVASGGVDVYHPTYYHTTLSEQPSPPAVVVTVHDMIHEVFGDLPDGDRLRMLKRRAVERADAVVVPSQSTKSDLERLLKVPSERIAVIPHGANFTGSEESACKPPTDKPYVLYVGSRRGYKNFSRFFDVLSWLMLDDVRLHLVCAGGGRFTREESRMFAQYGLDHRVIAWPGHAEALIAAYRHAAVFVCPSLYEGFGMPVLEAMALGCPVAVSTASSLPEVAGDAAMYFDPQDEEGMAEAIRHLLYGGKSRQWFIEQGRVQAARFSWEKSAAAHAELYRSLSR